MPSASLPAPEYQIYFNLKTGNTPGGNSYTGKVIRQIMAPEMLQELRMLLPDCDDNAAHLFIDYLEALRELHCVLVKPELDEDYGYEGAFEEGQTLCMTNDEHLETAHP